MAVCMPLSNLNNITLFYNRVFVKMSDLLISYFILYP